MNRSKLIKSAIQNKTRGEKSSQDDVVIECLDIFFSLSFERNEKINRHAHSLCRPDRIKKKKKTTARASQRPNQPKMIRLFLEWFFFL